MFDLKREVERWSAKAYAGPCRGKAAASIAELEDHLYCEIERLEDEGRTEEEAFYAATAKLDAAGIGAAPREQCALRRGQIANGIVWAALTIATALLLPKESFMTLLTVIVLPGWLASDLIVASVHRRAPA
jgi:hypothetical protein